MSEFSQLILRSLECCASPPAYSHGNKTSVSKETATLKGMKFHRHEVEVSPAKRGSVSSMICKALSGF